MSCIFNALGEYAYFQYFSPNTARTIPDPDSEYDALLQQKLFFSRSGKEPLSYDWLAVRVKALFNKLGLKSEKVLHSFRKAMACFLQMVG